jgi:colanic acid/amylovoran biosynthesis glycosyltransferase
MSENMKGDLLEIGCPEKKVEVHYYGTDTSFFNFDKSYKSKEKVTLLILASLVPKKGHLFLLKSIRELIKNNITNFKLRIVGTGELEGELKRFVSEANMDEYVDFEGVIAYGSMEWLNEYKFADVFIHPSVTPQDGDKEGIPGTIIEAMASGLPVIATYHAGIPHIIKNDVTGLLVKENSVKDLTSAIRSLITDPNKRKRIGLAGKDHAITKLDLKEKEKELERIYCSLIGS